MKKYLTVIISFCCSVSAFTQKNYLDKVADSTCKCLEVGKSKVKNAATFDKLGEACFAKGAGPYLDSFAKDENIPVEELTNDIATKLGQKIGLKLVASCPVFIDLMAAYSEDEVNNNIVTGTATGLVTAVQISDHVYVTVKDYSGKITKMVWLEYFPGADEYKSNPARLKGRQIEVEWKEAEIYHIVKKDFNAIKAITKLVVQ